MKNKLTDNLILKVLSVLMAILIWIVVLNINDPNKTRIITGVKVEVMNESVITDNGQVYTITEGQLINVTVTGPRTIVDSLKASDFTATADFKDLSQANSVPINVEINEYAYQQKVTINKTSYNTIQLSIENLTEEEYDVEVRYAGTAADNYVVAETKLDSPTVKVTAPESVHENIKQVSVTVDISGAAKDFEVTVPVKVYDSKAVELVQAENNVSVDTTNIKASNTVYYTKKIPVVYDEITGRVNGLEISRISLSMNEVSIMGRKEAVDEVTQLVLPTESIVIDGTGSEVSREYDLEELLPTGVCLNNTSKTLTLTVFLEETVQKVLTINVADIGIKNIPDGMDASIVDSGTVSITIEGTKQIIDGLDTDSISAFVSLRYLEEGITSVPVELQLAEGVEQVTNATVRISLTSTESRQTTEPEITEPGTTDQPVSSQQESTTEAGEATTGTQQPETTTQDNSTQQQET